MVYLFIYLLTSLTTGLFRFQVGGHKRWLNLAIVVFIYSVL